MNDEKWLPIRGYEDHYEVSDMGRIRKLETRDKLNRVHPSHIIKQAINSRWKYMQASLWKNGIGHTFRVHSLVAYAFLGARPDGMDINHKDGNKANNRADNLEYCTRSQNILHAIDNGLLKKRGEDHHGAKLRVAQVEAIRQASSNGQTGISLAQEYGMSTAQISRIINGRRWREEFPRVQTTEQMSLFTEEPR